MYICKIIGCNSMHVRIGSNLHYVILSNGLYAQNPMHRKRNVCVSSYIVQALHRKELEIDQGFLKVLASKY